MGLVMGQEQDKANFMNFSVVIWILAVIVLVFLGAAQLFGTAEEAFNEQDSSAIAAYTAPVGKVRMAGDAIPEDETGEEVAVEAEVAVETADPGKQVYSSLCFSCHGTGLPGIPQLGDKAAWADRIAQGKALLYERALTGFTGASGMPMPPKGGNTALSDEEVRAAVDYMVANAE